MVDINYLAVFLAAVSSMAVGSVWYAQGVFGKAWMKLAKIKADRTPKTAEVVVLLGSTFVASLVTAYVLAHVSFLSNTYFKHDFLQDALTTAFWLWLGLTAARIFVHDAFESRPWKLTLMTAAHELVTILLMALIIGLFGAK